MADRSRQPAVLLRKIARLEARLAETEAQRRRHSDYERELIYRVVDAELKLQRLQAVMNGEDDE